MNFRRIQRGKLMSTVTVGIPVGNSKYVSKSCKQMSFPCFKIKRNKMFKNYPHMCTSFDANNCIIVGINISMSVPVQFL